MIGALLCGAAALVCWPRAGGVNRLSRMPGASALSLRGRAHGRRGTTTAVVLVAVLVGMASTPLVAALAAGGVAAAARGEQRRRRRRLDDRRVRGLADALSGFAADLRAGRPVDEAALSAGASCPDGLTAEALARALRAPEAVRVPPPDSAGWGEAVVRIAAGARLSARTGCSLAAVACAVEDDLRGRLRQQQDLRTAVAAPQASAALLAALPLLALAMGNGIGADPWRVLTTTPVGNLLLVLGVGLETAGLAWSARLVRHALP